MVRKTDDEVMTRLSQLLDAKGALIEDADGNERILNLEEIERLHMLEARIFELQWVCGFGPPLLTG